MGLLTVNLPNLPSKELVEVQGHGLFFNGAVYEVDSVETELVIGEPKDTKPVSESTRQKALDKVLGVEETPETPPPVKDEDEPAPDAGTEGGDS